MNLRWVKIEEFHNYSISNYGEVINEISGKIIAQSVNRNGIVKVNLINNNVHYTRSVKVLVAEGFVSGRSENFNTPILLDGDYRNNYADNILWRPRWFAYKYARQFFNLTVHHDRGPIRDVDTRECYLNFFEAAIVNGILVRDILTSVTSNIPIFPTQQRFEFIK